MQRSLRVLSPMIVAAISLIGCSRAQESFETIQMCVGNHRGVAELKNVMMTVAQSEGLQFIDNSAQQGTALKDIGADKALKRDAASVIDFYIEGANGMGVTAGNLGLPPYQVGLGFTEGDDPAKAHRLADQLVRALSQRWDVQRIPPRQRHRPHEKLYCLTVCFPPKAAPIFVIPAEAGTQLNKKTGPRLREDGD